MPPEGLIHGCEELLSDIAARYQSSDGWSERFRGRTERCLWNQIGGVREIPIEVILSRKTVIVRMNLSDQELLRRMLAGDEDAFTAIYRARQAPVYRFALQMTGRGATAEDVTQEVFIALIEHGRRYDASRGTLASFLYGIARNLVLRRIAKDRDTGVAEELAGEHDLLGDLTRRETVEQVRRAVLSLPTAYREAIVLCDLEDLSYQDAALALDCPVGTVRSRLNRGRAMLAQKLRCAAAPVSAAGGIV